MVKDIVSQLAQAFVGFTPISTNGETVGMSIDTADFDEGMVFMLVGFFYFDGVYTLVFDESEDEVDWSRVSEDKYIGTPPVLSASTPDFTPFPKIGLFSNKRYVRPVIISTGVSTGIGGIATIATIKPEIMPETIEAV